MRGDCESCGLLLFADIVEGLAAVLNLYDGFLKVLVSAVVLESMILTKNKIVPLKSYRF
jgi:hypothetical protein